MKELTAQELKDVQLKIMDYVDSFCRQNNIQYTLTGGSLLGAVRHGGYIPWDDDIDIALLRSEYIRFTTIWNNSKENHPFELINIESGNNMGYPFGKVHDPQTVTYVGRIERTGVFVDVFPYDYVKDESDFRTRYNKILKLYNQRTAIFSWMQNKLNPGLSMAKIKSWLLCPRCSYNDNSEMINRLANGEIENADYLYEMVQGFPLKNLIPSSIFTDFKDISFEDRIYRTVTDYDTYLTKVFGDYMTPPPTDEQVTHHSFKAYWR